MKLTARVSVMASPYDFPTYKSSTPTVSSVSIYRCINLNPATQGSVYYHVPAKLTQDSKGINIVILLVKLRLNFGDLPMYKQMRKATLCLPHNQSTNLLHYCKVT